MSTVNGISVIVPTYNRADLLHKTLLSLSYQVCTGFDFEVVVVDDGSNDHTKKTVESYFEQLSISYVYQDDLGYRVARARNQGIASAKYDVCVFLDSGMVAKTDLLQIHYLAHLQSENLVLIGSAYGMNEFETTQSMMPHDFDCRSSLDNLFKVLSGLPQFNDERLIELEQLNINVSKLDIPWILFWTCHVSCRKSVLTNVGGFDEWFTSWGGEDVELGIRLHRVGCEFEFLKNQISIHSPHFRDTEENKAFSNNNCKYIYAQHPCKATKLLASGNIGWSKILLNSIKEDGFEYA